MTGNHSLKAQLKSASIKNHNTKFMLHKNTKQKELDTFPFTEIHIKKFKEELDQAGGFENLMVKKMALKKEDGMTFVALFSDIESYRQSFLRGAYESLQEFYDTEIPYEFWAELNRAVELKANETTKE